MLTKSDLSTMKQQILSPGSNVSQYALNINENHDQTSAVLYNASNVPKKAELHHLIIVPQLHNIKLRMHWLHNKIRCIYINNEVLS